MDPSYEFIAPQFVDFTSMDPDGDGDEDKFFDVNETMNETAEEEVLGYLTAREEELTEGALEEDEQEAEEEVDIIEASNNSSNNSDNEENGPSNEVKFTCAVIRMPHLTNTVG